jgi:hypothetical protein
LDDLRDVIPGFDTRCRVLTRTCYRGKWPGFRTVPGSPVPHRTPVKGLFNVGDASCPRGFAGSMGAATSAMLVRDDADLRQPATVPDSAGATTVVGSGNGYSRVPLVGTGQLLKEPESHP